MGPRRTNAAPMVRLIGDVHGKISGYLDIVRGAEYSIQLGDFGFRDKWNWLNSSGLSPDKHKILGGNHEHYPSYFESKYSLGNFGVLTHGGISFFYLRGAKSIDKYNRVEGVDWFQEEEIDYRVMSWALDVYAMERPSIVITHDCPLSIKRQLIGGTCRDATSYLLQSMLDIHKPDAWYFGHHHRSWRSGIFRCLNILEYLDV